MTRNALWQQMASYPADLDRQLIAALWTSGGVVSGMAVTVAAGRDVHVASGAFTVALAGGHASVLCISDAVETVTFPAAPPGGQSRIDLLALQVFDETLDAGSRHGFDFVVIPGAPAATPSPPAVPARAGVIAFVTSVGGQPNLAQSNIGLADVASGIVGAATLASMQGIVNGTASMTGAAIFTRGMTYASPTFTILSAGAYQMSYWNLLLSNGGNGAGATWRMDIQRIDAAGNSQQLGGFNCDFLATYPAGAFAPIYQLAAGDRITPQITGSGMGTAVQTAGGQFALTRI